MTETTTSAEAPPPSDYGYAEGTEWASKGDDYYVPAELRAHYRVVDPRPVEIESHVQYGTHVVEDRSAETVRVLDAGDETHAPRVITEKITKPTLIHKSGPEYYRRWLHDKRIDLAIGRKRAPTRQRRGRRRGWCARCATPRHRPWWWL